MHTPIHHPLRLLLPALAALLILGGCSTLSSTWTSLSDLITGGGVAKTTLKNLEVVAQADANQTSATRLDLVFVYKDELKAMLPKKSQEWFARKDEFAANLWQNMDIVSLEIPPAYVIEQVQLPKRYDTALQVTAYANYLDKKGLQPVDLTGSVNAKLTLLQKQLALEEVK